MEMEKKVGDFQEQGNNNAYDSYSGTVIHFLLPPLNTHYH
jgi:hypothetical protein